MNVLYKWALPVMVLVIGAAYVTLPSPFASPASRSLKGEAEDRAHRQLVAPYSKATSIPLPAFYSSMADVWEPFATHETPFLWAVPRTGTNTFQNLIWWCMGKVVAGRACRECHNKVSLFVEDGLGHADTLVKWSLTAPLCSRLDNDNLLRWYVLLGTFQCHLPQYRGFYQMVASRVQET